MEALISRFLRIEIMWKLGDLVKENRWRIWKTEVRQRTLMLRDAKVWDKCVWDWKKGARRIRKTHLQG